MQGAAVMEGVTAGHLLDVECILSKQPRKVSSGLVARVVFQQVYTIDTSKGGATPLNRKSFRFMSCCVAV